MTNKCQWIGNGEGCEHDAVKGRSYCEQHVWLVYQKGTALGRRKKDIQTANNIRIWEDCFNQAVEELENEGFL
jgi:hypothetical protein